MRSCFLLGLCALLGDLCVDDPATRRIRAVRRQGNVDCVQSPLSPDDAPGRKLGFVNPGGLRRAMTGGGDLRQLLLGIAYGSMPGWPGARLARDRQGVPLNTLAIRFAIELPWIWRLAMEKIVLPRDPDSGNVMELDVNGEISVDMAAALPFPRQAWHGPLAFSGRPR
jgi:hypothetical protein